jgi:hypothetical protein
MAERESKHNLDLPPDTEARLDLLLAEWVDHRGLSTARAEQLRRAVLATHESDAAPPAVAASPLDQGPEWWSSLFTPLLTALSQAATTGYQNVGPGKEAEPDPCVGYRAYIRLA